ncbi:MAG: peptidylprolyl isomerase [Saprospiraceae bacterium]|nr:peptidylprolyl isomerase [Saprospiraceae bacterium]
MSISKHKVVTLHYTLKEGAEDGKMIEETFGGTPISFIFGIGQMIPGFEAHLEGKDEGHDYAFLLSPEEAYGNQNPNALVEVPKKNFENAEGKIDEKATAVGQPVRMKNPEGQTFQGTIVDDKEDKLVVDFNHPMAGKSLHFSGSIISIREASKEEIEHGHVHDGTHH